MRALLEHQIQESIHTKHLVLNHLMPAIEAGVKLLLETFAQGGKILSCGNGGSANDAQHLATELINRYERDRPSLPALALNTDGSLMTAIGNDYHFEDCFAKQITGLGQAGDCLVAISTSGQSPNIVKAVASAHAKDMRVLILTGRDGGLLLPLMKERDVGICVPVSRTARIQEAHLLILHCLCELIDETLYPREEL